MEPGGRISTSALPKIMNNHHCFFQRERHDNNRNDIRLELRLDLAWPMSRGGIWCFLLGNTLEPS